MSLIYTVTRRSEHPPGQAGAAVRWHSIRPVSIGRQERVYICHRCACREGAAEQHRRIIRGGGQGGGGSGQRTMRWPPIDASAGNCAVWSALLLVICAPRRRHTHPSPHPRPPAVSERDTQCTHTRAAETARVWVRASQSSTNRRAQAANADEARRRASCTSLPPVTRGTYPIPLSLN